MGILVPCRSCLHRLRQSSLPHHGNVSGSYLPLGAALAHHTPQRRLVTTYPTSRSPKNKPSSSASPATSQSKASLKPSMTPSQLQNSPGLRVTFTNQESRPQTLQPTPSASLSPSTASIDLSSTLPASLDLPTPLSPPVALTQRFSYLYALGKASLTFYKTGFKNIIASRRLLNHLRPTLQKVTGTKYPSPASILSLAITPNPNPSTSTSTSTSNAPPLPRALLALSLRTRHDLSKLPLMGLILLVCGEFTPLVLLALGEPVTPYTCRMPAQRTKAARKLLKRTEFANEKTSDLSDDRVLAFVHEAAGWGMPALMGFSGTIARRGLRDWCEAVVADAWLLAQEKGGVEALSREEVVRFAVAVADVQLLRRVVQKADERAEKKEKGETVFGEGLTDHELAKARDGIRAFVAEVKLLVQREKEREKVWRQAESMDAVRVFADAARNVRNMGLSGPWMPVQKRGDKNLVG